MGGDRRRRLYENIRTCRYTYSTCWPSSRPGWPRRSSSRPAWSWRSSSPLRPACCCSIGCPSTLWQPSPSWQSSVASTNKEETADSPAPEATPTASAGPPRGPPGPPASGPRDAAPPRGPAGPPGPPAAGPGDAAPPPSRGPAGPPRGPPGPQMEGELKSASVHHHADHLPHDSSLGQLEERFKLCHWQYASGVVWATRSSSSRVTLFVWDSDTPDHLPWSST